jgi:flagellar basal-body rod modification protein FlgD
MATSVINGVAGPSTIANSGKTDRGTNALSSDDFFKLLVTELQQQDPLAPAKTGDMINQVAQIRSIELSKNLNDTLQSMTNSNQTAGVSGLLGKLVAAKTLDSDGNVQEITGVVTAIRFADDGTAVLELDTGQTVAAKDVTRIASVDAQSALTSPVTATTAPTTAASTANTASAAYSPSTLPNYKSPQTQRQVIDLFPWLDSGALVTL